MKKICRLGQNRLRIQNENFIHPVQSRFLERFLEHRKMLGA